MAGPCQHLATRAVLGFGQSCCCWDNPTAKQLWICLLRGEPGFLLLSFAGLVLPALTGIN